MVSAIPRWCRPVIACAIPVAGRAETGVGHLVRRPPAVDARHPDFAAENSCAGVDFSDAPEIAAAREGVTIPPGSESGTMSRTSITSSGCSQ
jgi:hypothetical protein